MIQTNCLKLNVRAPINSLGYGVTARNIIKALHKLGVHITLWPIGNIQCEPEETQLFQQCINNQANYSKYDPSLVIFHQFALAEHIGKGKQIGFPIFELDKFTSREKHHLSQQDGLVVTSQWAADIVMNNGILTPITIAPLGVDREIFNEKEDDSVKISETHTIFFTAGKFEIRKGHDFLIRCFDKAFSSSDNVILYLCCHNPFLNKEQQQWWLDLIKNCKNRDNIKLVPYQKTQKDLARLMKSVDTGIFVSHAEGFNLELLEVMSCGRPVICTNFSAHREFCTNENAYLIDVDETEPAYDGIWFNGQIGSWAKFEEKQENQLIKYMQNIDNWKQSGWDFKTCEKLYTNCIETAEYFSWDRTAKHILEATHEIKFDE